MNKETNSTVLRDTRPERESPVRTAKKYGRTYRRPDAIPYGTKVEDAHGEAWERTVGGWASQEDEEADLRGTTDLAFPLRVILEQSGDRKPRGNDRASRRERGRLKAKARAAKVLRQVHAAEKERERSRLEALEDRDRVRNGEEVGA